LPKNYFPFGDDLGGNTFCISLNLADYGKIYFVDESGEVDLVADSFEDFMAALTDAPDE
jgi:hypothetical protein